MNKILQYIKDNSISTDCSYYIAISSFCKSINIKISELLKMIGVDDENEMCTFTKIPETDFYVGINWDIDNIYVVITTENSDNEIIYL